MKYRNRNETQEQELNTGTGTKYRNRNEIGVFELDQFASRLFDTLCSTID